MVATPTIGLPVVMFATLKARAVLSPSARVEVAATSVFVFTETSFRVTVPAPANVSALVRIPARFAQAPRLERVKAFELAPARLFVLERVFFRATLAEVRLRQDPALVLHRWALIAIPLARDTPQVED